MRILAPPTSAGQMLSMTPKPATDLPNSPCRRIRTQPFAHDDQIYMNYFTTNALPRPLRQSVSAILDAKPSQHEPSIREE